jgi:hypothetical protein
MPEETNEIDYVAALKESAQIMYVTLNGVFELHEIVEEAELTKCGYCSALAKEDILYPCPTAAILLADLTIDSSEPSESEEPSA